MDKFLFISYKSDDRDRIRPYLDWLDKLGVKYWWDQEILHQNYGTEIEQKLSECSAVLGFMTEKAFRSGPVLVEFRDAQQSNKLVPVKLDQSNMPYEFKGVIASVNYVDLSGTSQQRIDDEKARLIRKIEEFIGNRLATEAQHVLPDIPSSLNLEAWICNQERLPHIAYLFSLCVFEGRNHDHIQMCATLLEQKFTEAGLEKLLRLNNSLTIKKAKLKLLGAESVQYQSEVLDHQVEYIRFENHLLNEELLVYIWNELDQLKAPIVDWVEELIEQRPECIDDVATSLSKIGRKDFFSIYSLFLHRWLIGRSTAKFRCADLTLSLMTSDANVRGYIRDKLFEISDGTPELENVPASVDGQVPPSNSANEEADETSKSESFISNNIAVLLVTGFTGMAMPDLSIQVFKKVEAKLLDPATSQTETNHIVRQIRKGISFILEKSKTDIYAKAMLKVFASGIKSWAVDDVQTDRSLVPEYIFLILLSGLTVGRDRDSNSISLSALFTEDRVFVRSVVNAFAPVIAGALESGSSVIRDGYKDLVRRWVDQLKTSISGQKLSNTLALSIDADRQAFKELFKTVFDLATTENDKYRIRDLCKPVFVL
jgi:TIR domain